MRRVKSAPANLCAMAHKRRKRPVRVAPHMDQRVGEAEAMGEVVTTIMGEMHVDDSTEQLFVYILLRRLVSMEDLDWSVVVVSTIRRMIASYVSHQLMCVVLLHTVPWS